MHDNIRLVSWNVNGLRACIKKGFTSSMTALNPDVICLQEIKMLEGQADPGLPGFHAYWNSAQRKGYSGTAILARKPPLNVTYGMGIPHHDTEGRIIAAEFEHFILVTVYTPNSKDELTRLPYRMEWEDDFRTYLTALAQKKPVAVCGDLNVAHEEIDLKNPRSNRRNAGFTDEERGKLSALLSNGYHDVFREQNPGLTGAYSWWSFRGNARANNTGWRIDYFLASGGLLPLTATAAIHPDIIGSDHCPVSLELSCPL